MHTTCRYEHDWVVPGRVFVIPNEPSKCSCLHGSIYLANGNHEKERSESRMISKGYRVGVSLLDLGKKCKNCGIFAQNIALKGIKKVHYSEKSRKV